MNLLERVNATQETINRFHETTFEWGVNDCGTLVHQHLLNCGYETSPYAQVGSYSTALGAKRAMRKLGQEGMEGFLDAMGLKRIAPAMVLPGDLVAFPGGEEGDEWLALGVAVDAGQHIIGYANGICCKGPVKVCTLAWRVA